MWAAGVVAADVSGSVPLDGKGNTQIWIWRPILGAVALEALVARVSCRAKALRFGADAGDTCGCCSPLEDGVLVLLSVSGFQVKTLVGSGDA